MKFTSIRLRLTLWNVGILALALCVVLVAVHTAVRMYMLTNIDRRLHGMADRINTVISRPNSARDYLRSRERETGTSTRPRNTRSLRVYDLRGHTMTRDWQYAEVQEPPWDAVAYARAVHGSESFSTVKGDDSTLRVFTRPVLRNKQQIGVLQVGFSLHEMDVLLEGLTTITLVLTPCVLLLAGLCGLFLTNRALRPVASITHAADALNAEDLSQRLPVVGADEFAHLAEAINRTLTRLDAAFTGMRLAVEQQRRFTADASHELRTPLTAIKANTSLALRCERTPAQYREALAGANQAADVMNRLIQDLLLLARSDARQLALTPQTVDPDALFREAVALTCSAEAQATVCIEIPDPAVRVYGDPHHLLRLVVNLLDNALRYTPPEGTITLAAKAEDETVQLSVADTGEGIAPEHLAHLGERFYRVDTSRARQYGGAGLGLAICKTIVDAHQGTFSIASTLGVSTCVTVRLPRDPGGA